MTGSKVNMTELEEELYCETFDEDGVSTVDLNVLPSYTMDWSKLPGWKDKMICKPCDLPRFELHHSIKVLHPVSALEKKDDSQTKAETKQQQHENRGFPLISSKDLAECTQQHANEFCIGGWFLFAPKRVGKEMLLVEHHSCNEFSNDSYERCLERLQMQSRILREITCKLLPQGQTFVQSCSLERVHAIWCF